MNIYEYMERLSPEIINEGVDALTLTATGLDGKISIAYVLQALSRNIEQERKKDFRFQGAKGWSRGSVRYAEKVSEENGKLWAILMVTGDNSSTALKAALGVKGVNYTRVDTYIDVKLRERVIDLARKFKDAHKEKAGVKLIESNTGATLYVGSRQSESLLRVYDKSAEYEEELGHVWRFEVEIKGKLAPLAAQEIEETGVAGIREMVFREGRTKGLPLPSATYPVREYKRAVSLVSSEMKLNWLSRQVAPTVKWLCQLGMRDKVLEQLGLLDDCLRENKRTS